MTGPVQITSVFNPATRVTIDPWGENPLVDDARQAYPDFYAMAVKEGSAPTMFVSGALPPFTASGVDPQVLMRLPFRARHHAAALTKPLEVLGLVEQHSGDADFEVRHQGLTEYFQRVRAWIGGSYKTKADTKAELDQFYSHVFDAYDAADKGLQKRLQQGETAADLMARRLRIGQYAPRYNGGQR